MFERATLRFKKIQLESDDDLRRLEREAKRSPKDLGAWKRYNAALRRAGQKTQNPPRDVFDLMKGAATAKERASGIMRRGSDANELQTNQKKLLRRVPTWERSRSRSDELEARMSGNKRAEIAAGRKRKLLKVLAKHAKSIPGDTSDGRYRRLDYLAIRAGNQLHDLNHYRKLGSEFKRTQDPERVSRYRMSTRTRRQNGIPGWKDDQ